MGLIGSDYRHALQGTDQRDFVADCDAIIVPWNYLFVVRIRAFDQPSEDSGERRSEAQVIVTLCDLEIFLSWEQTTDLLERFWWNNQISTWGTDRRDRQ